MPPNGKLGELINYVCQPWIEHPVFVPAVGQRTTPQSVLAIIGRGRFGTVLFSLPLVSDCLYDIRDILNVI